MLALSHPVHNDWLSPPGNLPATAMNDNPVLLDIAQLLEAGIAPLDAVERLHSDRGGEQRALAGLSRDLKQGRSLAVAVSAAGFATWLDSEILKAAENAGKLTVALRLVAANFERRRSRAARLRMRLWLPNTVMFIALAIGVVRATTAGAALSAALFNAIAIALTVTVVTQTMVVMARRDPARWLSFGWGFGLQRNNALFRQYFEQTFYTLFAWQTDAGLDYVAGAKNLAGLIDVKSYRSAVDRYQRLVTAGGAVADALQRAQLMVPGELAEIFKVGEQSGRLVAALQHYLTDQGYRLERITTNIFTWIPRIYYGIVVVIAAASLL